MRAETWISNGAYTAKPAGRQGSGMLTSMIGANSLLVLDAGSGSLKAGDRVDALLLSLPALQDRQPNNLGTA